MNFVLKLSIIGVVVCVHLLLLNGSYGQTSQIEMGTLNFPVIYNRTINIPAEQRPWYNRLFGWFSRSPAPIQNVTYTFPPSSNQSMDSDCTIAGVNVMDIDLYGNGGLAKVIGGGLKQNNVTIRFTSKPGEAILFRVTVTGYCSKNYAANQPYGWAEPLRSYGRYNASSNSSNIYNNSSAMRFANYSLPGIAASAQVPWWHFW